MKAFTSSGRSGLERAEQRRGLSFVSPWLVGLLRVSGARWYGPPPLEARAQLRSIRRRLDRGEAEGMQRFFYEGRLFAYTFYGFALVNVATATPDDADRQSPCVLVVVNCIVRDGGDEIYNDDRSVINATFSNIQQAGARTTFPGEGNINADPYFANPDSGDFHLKSEAGRWHSDTQSWIRDETTSPCIDAGDAAMALGAEPAPNGGVINMGAYGGTALASKSL